ncbi:MAG: protein translocase subunit SecF, partial [Candidatus Micrarchaeota archaeon]|nr:protein translocase subunit SecF [Candidatus Micrarchaeota archaeon]
IAAFVLISIAVLVIFRAWAPSLAIIFGAGNDMIIALGAMVLLNIPLGLASLGGLLMLIGYAIDTEIITAVRILKRRERTPEERAYGAMKTGMTMTAAAIASFAVLFAVSLVAYVPTYYEISGVVLFGLIGDLITTWLGNAPMILLYKKRHERN